MCERAKSIGSKEDQQQFDFDVYKLMFTLIGCVRDLTFACVTNESNRNETNGEEEKEDGLDREIGWDR